MGKEEAYCFGERYTFSFAAADALDEFVTD